MTFIDILHFGKIGCRCAQINFDASLHGSAVANFLGQHASIEITETGHALFLEPIAQTAGCSPVRIMVRIVLDQNPTGVDPVRFKKGGKTVFVLDGTVGNTVIPHHGCRDGQNLSLVGRIGQILGISHHARGKDNLNIY